MMTQQYTTLRHIIYFIILIFHISVLFLLYNYSTKFNRDHLAQHLTQDSLGHEHSILEKFSAQESEEAIVTFENNQLPQVESSKPDVIEFPIPVSPPLNLLSPKSEQALYNNDEPKPLMQKHKQSEITHPKELPITKMNNESTKEDLLEVPIIRTAEKLIPPTISPIKQNQLKQNLKKKTAQVTDYSKTNWLDYSINEYVSPDPVNISSNTAQIAASRSNISPAAFFQAFKDSYYQEQSSLGNPQSINNQLGSSNIKNSDTFEESLVNERLGELKIADYIQKIKKAFQEAAKRTPGMYLNSGKELKTDIDVRLEIQSQGSVKIAKFQSCGIAEIDDYIKKFLLDIIVSPIPKRYKINALPFSTKILINIDKNTRFYTLRCFF